MQKGEKEIFHLKRHPIGLLFIYGICTFILLAVGVILFAVAPSALPNNTDTIASAGSIIFILVALLTIVAAFIANKVYWGNAWVLTSDSITQIKQTSLFDRQQSQLSLANLEDISAEQNGILTHMFNYGVLKCETAGEHSKFVFIYCPNPTRYAQDILRAREEFEQGIRHEIGGTNVNAG